MHLEKEYVHFIYEKYQKGDLFSFLEINGYLNEEKASILISTLLKVLAFIHGHGIMHRNLKLENIIIMDASNFESVKLQGFGLSEEIASGTKIHCGTPGYITP